MAGKGGGGAWKVAYADFVTAMMAFFLVMWICGQDQKIRKAVSYYFNDPSDTSMVGNSKQASRTGSVADNNNMGSVPLAESVAMGRGRKSFSSKEAKTPATKLVSDFLNADENTRKYWEETAEQTRQAASKSDEVKSKRRSADEVATAQLARRLQVELGHEISAKTTGIQQDLLMEIAGQVNWKQIAEDLLPP